MKTIRSWLLVLGLATLAGCTTTQQNSAADFQPPEGDYRLIVMRPDVQVSLLTAGGLLERRADWTDTARENVLGALREQQRKRGGKAVIAASFAEAGDAERAEELDRLHAVVGASIRVHKYTPGMQLPSKQGRFDWTLGESAVSYGRDTGYQYALFLHVQDSFSSGGRVALQAVSMLGCVVGVCFIPESGRQVAFASLVDLRDGRVVWFNFLTSEDGDIRDPEGAEQLVDLLLDDMKAGSGRGAKG